jgi:hypothetical protein
MHNGQIKKGDTVEVIISVWSDDERPTAQNFYRGKIRAFSHAPESRFKSSVFEGNSDPDFIGIFRRIEIIHRVLFFDIAHIRFLKIKGRLVVAHKR